MMPPLLLTLLLLQTPAPQAASFRVAASYVKVPVTVFDERGRLLDDLDREDFEVLDDGEPTPIINFVRDLAPINVLLLLDSSGSLKDELEEIKHAALRFAQSFTRDDRISIMSFSDETVLLTPWTNRLGKLRKGLNKMKKGYRTAIYDALGQSIESHLNEVQGKRVIILLTDGLDNESVTPYDQILSRLIESQVTLYIVSRTRLVDDKVRDSERVQFLNQVMRNVLQDDSDFVDDYFKKKETAMVNLAESTGGRVLFPEVLAELGNTYAQVARELKHQYLLTFLPPQSSGKKFRSIQVTCNLPAGRVYSRKQYLWLGLKIEN